MMHPSLQDVLQRASAWPAAAQEQLADIALHVERGLVSRTYFASDEELAAMDEGAAELDAGHTADPEKIENILRSFRSA